MAFSNADPLLIFSTTHTYAVNRCLQPMSEDELNGEGFHYLVTYTQLHEPSSSELKQAVRNWRQSELYVSTPDPFVAYVIYVQSVNNEGFAPVRQLQQRVAFSGEGSKCRASCFILTHTEFWLIIHKDLHRCIANPRAVNRRCPSFFDCRCSYLELSLAPCRVTSVSSLPVLYGRLKTHLFSHSSSWLL